MSGYRGHGSFDPNAYETLGQPLKPFNWVQWTGVAVQVVGAVLITLDIVGRIGWTPRLIGDLSPAPFMLMIVGVVLINSRREPGIIMDEQQRDKNKRLLIITVAICAAILSAAVAIESLGA